MIGTEETQLSLFTSDTIMHMFNVTGSTGVLPPSTKLCHSSRNREGRKKGNLLTLLRLCSGIELIGTNVSKIGGGSWQV